MLIQSMERMNRILAIVLILALNCHFMNGQRRGAKVEALRTSYIIKQVAMTGDESARFWPVYNEYHEKLRTVRRNLIRTHRTYSETMSDEEVKALAAKEVELRRMEKEIHSVYSEKIVAIIGHRKYLRLRQAEEQFRREMLKSARDD